MKEPLVVDFETQGIVGNPTVNPPEPVGVALKNPGYKARYFSWGHPSDNNCDGPGQAITLITQAITDKRPLLFHNAKFDVSVMKKWWGINPPLIEDTLFLIFLEDPYAQTFSLKPSAERILGLPPDEQDDLRKWIVTHIPKVGKEWGAHIASAPGEVVAPYAKGDVDRTWKLYTKLKPVLPEEPYKRELRLLPIIMASEEKGVRCDLERLEEDLAKYERALLTCEGRIAKILGSDSVNCDSGEELANALDKAGLISTWPRTPTGRRSTARDALLAAVTHRGLGRLLAYRGALAHCLSNFMRPWMGLASTHAGRLHPEWNQVRQARGDNDNANKGTRTGRLSCLKPNFQNPPNVYDVSIPGGLLPLPVMRRYLMPDKGHIWLKRDYSQQELRILAHFSEGQLYTRYQKDPCIDAHKETQQLLKEIAHKELERKAVKILGFSIIYGSGITHLAKQLGVPYAEGQSIRDAYFVALPEVRKLMNLCQDIGRRGDRINTWGGRKYPVEPPAMVNGRMQNYEYKLLNYLIQGSAADCTKEAIIRWAGNCGNGQFLATVHDEINIQAPALTWKRDMAKLQAAMESVEFDIKMLSDGFKGPSWAQLEVCK